MSWSASAAADLVGIQGWSSPLRPFSLVREGPMIAWSQCSRVLYRVHNDGLAWMHGVFGAFTPIRVSTKAENCADIFTRRPILPNFRAFDSYCHNWYSRVYFFPAMYIFFYAYMFSFMHMFVVALHKTALYVQLTVSPSFALVAINSITLRRSKNNTRVAFCSARPRYGQAYFVIRYNYHVLEQVIFRVSRVALSRKNCKTVPAERANVWRRKVLIPLSAVDCRISRK